MSTILTVAVTSEDIGSAVEEATQRSNTFCPIARAIRRIRPDSEIAVMNDGYAWIDGSGWRMPIDAQDFIVRFDDGRDVEPITFDLEYVQP